MPKAVKASRGPAPSGGNPKVDAYIGRAQPWQEEVRQLRALLRTFPLSEELKWGTPCYALDGKNIVLIHTFKEYCALLFFKGALLKDPRGLLVRVGENTQAGRQVRFSDLKDLARKKAGVTALLKQALAVEKAGLTVAFKKTADFEMPDEFRAKLAQSAALKAAFEGLTPGRQRAYLLHFAGAKQSKTREARVLKWLPQILKGKGLDD